MNLRRWFVKISESDGVYMTIYNILNTIGLPWAYGRFLKKTEPPFLILMGDGQETFDADNTHYFKENAYRVEYYFIEKNEANEETIESALNANGFLYEKSEDVYIESEDMFVIYYYC